MGNQNQNPSPLRLKNRLRMLLLGCRLPVPYKVFVTSNENDITSFTSQLCQKAEYDENLFVQEQMVTSIVLLRRKRGYLRNLVTKDFFCLSKNKCVTDS